MPSHCSPYHADSAFYRVIQQMSFAAGFASSDDANARLDKLEALITPQLEHSDTPPFEGALALQVPLGMALLARDLPDAERCLSEMAPLAQDHNLTLWLAFLPMGNERVVSGKDDKTSIEIFRKADAEFTATKFKMNIANFRVDLARSAFAMDLIQEATELAIMAQELIDETGETLAQSDVHRLQTAIALAGDDTDTAEKAPWHFPRRRAAPESQTL
jgi:hypothetical protein